MKPTTARARRPRSMRDSIRTPMLLLFLAFPLATLLIFNLAARVYVERSTRAELRSVASTLGPAIEKQFDTALSSQGQALGDALLQLQTSLRAAHLTEGTRLLLFDTQRKLVYPSAAAQENVVSAHVVNAIKQRLALLDNERILSFRMEGTRYYALSMPLTGAAENPPRLVFVATASVGFALLRAVNIILVIVLILGAALEALLANRVAKRIARPVTELSRAAKRVGSGEHSTLPPRDETEIAELRELGDSIDGMAARLSAAGRAQAMFLQNASHELKTPLMSIQGYAEGIRSGVLTDISGAADIIISESRRLNRLVEELLTLSRIENPSAAEPLTPVNLCDLLKEYVQRLGGIAAKLDRRLTLEVPNTPVIVAADDSLLSQAVLNIASNCLRYARTETRLTLTTDGASAVLRIRDDGAGIAPEDLPHIFERFYKGKGGNFGLGLAIAQSACAHLHGSLSACNDGGAVFVLRLPLTD